MQDLGAGPSQQSFYDVIVPSQPCYNLSDETFLQNNCIIMNIEKDGKLFGVYLYVPTVSFIWRGVVIAHVFLIATSMFTTKYHGAVVDISATLPLAIKQYVFKEALQWTSERQAQVQSYVSQTELTSELDLQCNYFTLVARHFRSKNN